jgi:O-antigen ligase
MMNPSLQTAEEWPDDGIPSEQPIPITLHVGWLRKAVLWMVGAYLILNIGFEMLRIPPVGPGVPVGELVLVVCLCVIGSRALLPMMAKEVWLLPVLGWWGLTLSRALVDAKGAGIWAFRDASQAIESLYLIVGFWFASSEISLQYFFRWLRRLLVVAIFYGLLYPVSGTLQNFSPKIAGLGTGTTPILFSMLNAPLMLVWGACWLLIERTGKRSGMGRDLLAGFLIAFSMAFGQSRTGYLEVIMLGGLLFLTKRKTAAKWGATLLLGGLIIGAVSISGISVKGRLGQKVSLDFIGQHLESISGSGAEDVQSEAAGVSLRIGWWRHIFAELESSPRKMIFGLGYGMPLTSFESKSAVTREPHNSYISVIGRLGIAGMAMWSLMQIALYASWWRSFRLCGRMQWTSDQTNLLLLLVFCAMTLVVGVGETAMEVPFYAIPYYFFFGVTLRYGKHLKLAAEREQRMLAEQDEEFDDELPDAEPA